MPIATLSIDLEARLANFEQGMNRAAQITQQSAKQINAQLTSIADASKTLGKVISGAFVGFSAVAFIKGTIAGLDALNDLKDATGASIENISALEDVAARTGTKFEGVATSLVKFNKVLSEAKPKSEAFNILKSLGLDAEALKKVDPAEALRQTAVALSKYADDGGKARIVQELFGKSVREVAPFLKDLATQGKLVATVTTEQAEAAEKFNQQLDAIAKNSQDGARALVTGLLPALDKIAAGFAKGGIKGALDGLGEAVGLGAEFHERRAMTQLKVVITDLEQQKARLDQVLKISPTSPLANDLERVNAQLAKRGVELEALRTKYLRLTDGSAGAGRGAVNPAFTPGLPGLKVPDVPKDRKEQISEASRALAQFVEQLDRQIEKEQDLTETQKALNFLQTIGTTGQIPQVRELVLNLAKKKEMLDAELEVQKGIAKFEEERAANQRKLDNEIDAASGRTLDAKKRELTERLETRLKAGELFSFEELERIVNGIAGISKQVRETQSDIEKFADQAASSISSTLGDNVFDALSGNFDNIEKAWGNMLKRMIANAIAANLEALLKPAFNNFLNIFGVPSAGGAGGAGGGGADVIGAPNTFTDTFYASARPVDTSGALRASARGARAANDSRSGGGVTINNNYVQAGVTRNEVLSAMQLQQRATEASIAKRLREARVS